MEPGDLLSGRFEIEHRAGSGGMGEVFRARDRAQGGVVAVKVLRDGTSTDERRFQRETAVLAELTHPGIVRYVAHGVSSAGQPYLAMEWLDGEDLATRLRRSVLSVDEAVLLGTRVAEALAAAHARGIVHRDLKPNNLFLVGHDIGRVKVLDFGIAQLGDATTVTKTGTVLGTPGYIAPEQARSGEEIDARADVFTLGCVLFKALTGTPVFGGDRLVIVLAKILFEEAPRVRDLRSDVPPSLDALIAQMLAKERDERPPDCAAVAAALKALGAAGPLLDEPPTSVSVPSSALTGSERRVFSAVLLGPVPPWSDAKAPALGAVDLVRADATLREVAKAHGGRLERLADGSLLVLISIPTRVATDQAAQAARCALALRASARQRPMALATGRIEVSGKQLEGDAIERAEQMLESSRLSHETVHERKPSVPAIVIDDVTAGLLDARFDVAEAPWGFSLQGEREISTEMRTLLGKPTSCVGRDAELLTLEAFWTECIEDSVARVVLVVGPAGIGKSRLTHELIRRIQRREEACSVWIGRSDSLRAGSAFGVLGHALRGALGIQDGEPVELRRNKLRAHVAEYVAESDRMRVTEFLGELVGTPFPDAESPPLRAARQDAGLMSDQLQQSVISLLRAETQARPVLLVLEDLHWGDLPTVRLIDLALRDAGDKSWMVLALARPEVHEIFPKLWTGRGVQELRLKALTRKASERLVRQALGHRVDNETIARLVQRAEGHAFYLEELIRAVADGDGATLPETVLAMVEARLSGLESEARRILRAASVFGETSWAGGVAMLLGTSERSSEVRSLLSTLVEQEVLLRRAESRFAGEPEFAFRHALLREGAYAMLTESDRILGHQLAAVWLEQHGESDPMVLAEHCDRGHEPARAAEFYLHAAEQAQRGGDSECAMTRARRGLTGDVPDPWRLALLGLLCEGHLWNRQWLTGVPYAEEILRLALPGSVPWARAAMVKLGYELHHGDLDAVMTTLSALLLAEPKEDAVGPMANALTMALHVSYNTGHPDLAAEILPRIKLIVEPVREREALARAWMEAAQAYYSPMIKEEPWEGVRFAEAARTSFMDINHQRGTLFVQVFLGMNLWILGAHNEAERELFGAIVMDAKFGLISGTFFLIEVLSDHHKLGDARVIAERMIEDARMRDAALDEGRGRWALADVLRELGDLTGAEKEAEKALQLLPILPMEHVAATATLTSIRLAQGRIAEALTMAEWIFQKYKEYGRVGLKGAFVRLVHAEALHAAGHHERARAAIAAAKDHLTAIASKIDAPAYRQSFLDNVPENARTFSLARAWLGEDSQPSASR